MWRDEEWERIIVGMDDNGNCLRNNWKLFLRIGFSSFRRERRKRGKGKGQRASDYNNISLPASQRSQQVDAYASFSSHELFIAFDTFQMTDFHSNCWLLHRIPKTDEQNNNENNNSINNFKQQLMFWMIFFHIVCVQSEWCNRIRK